MPPRPPCRHAESVGPRNRGDEGQGPEGPSLVFRKSAFRPDQHGERYARQRRQYGERVGRLLSLVAEDQATERFVALETAEYAIEFLLVLDGGHMQHAALLSRLCHVGPHPLDVHPARLGVLRQHRAHPADAHLHRLLHHIVEPGVLQRCEEIEKVRSSGLRSTWLEVEKFGDPPAAEPSTSSPVPAVEHQHAIAFPEAQHVEQIVALIAVEGHRRSIEWRWNKDARRAKIGMGHGHANSTPGRDKKRGGALRRRRVFRQGAGMGRVRKGGGSGPRTGAPGWGCARGSSSGSRFQLLLALLLERHRVTNLRRRLDGRFEGQHRGEEGVARLTVLR